MAHFAQIDENNLVIKVLVVPDEHENDGQNYLENILGLPGRWVQTSYNDNIRANYAGIGYTYNEVADVFIPPQPYPSWNLNEFHKWEAPTPAPNEFCFWDEEKMEWFDMSLGGDK